MRSPRKDRTNGDFPASAGPAASPVRSSNQARARISLQRRIEALRHTQALRHAESGQSLVEFAVCLPVLLLIVTGVLAFGITINNYLMLTDATNVGARLLAISRSETSDPCATTAAAIYAAAPNLSSSKFTFTFVLNGVTVPVTGTGASCSSSSTSTGYAADLVQGAPVKVTAKYPCSLALYNQVAPVCNLQVSTTEIVQ